MSGGQNNRPSGTAIVTYSSIAAPALLRRRFSNETDAKATDECMAHRPICVVFVSVVLRPRSL